MEDIHVAAINLVFAVNFAVTNHAQRFFIFDPFFDVRMVQIVLPKYSIVGS